ncbi:class II aldolase [Rhodovulum sulfidophilum]|uniref:Class II aldolase/adducin family protein n=1 Tax=Rhodovulum visakhapatnamense TaxID=364297 RepID=A0ABS1RJE2_9RHOB|nr:class II aldolase/adducin family protein [Rhodovulum visakhapatnamense]MBL3571475.1 class II aldolase/adducin family protein [Rhodovulum visakhapatnamense]MBL3579634.1 class II aldolase/adducin family protein [Rhodovulum visakhapatnamense]OLS45988.1 class II aldolase [Rhodovulum sulfidophilum]
MIQETDKRAAIVAACRSMNAVGLNQGSSGNISVRHGAGILITPSSIAYDVLAPEDIVFMEMDGTAHGARKPSSEWRFHLDILRARPDLNAVVHAHAPYCTMLAILHRPIPAVHYMVAAAGGGDIRCAPYETFGTQALSDRVLEALEGRKACLMAHHGMIAAEVSLEKAMWLAVEVETLARQYHGALTLGEPSLLTEAQLAEAVAQFSQGYGQAERG